MEKKDCLLKSKNKFRLACKICLFSSYTFTAAVLATGLTAIVFNFKHENVIQDFKDTEDYKTAILQQEDIVKDEFVKDLISGKEIIDKIEYIYSDENVEAILKSSSNPLKFVNNYNETILSNCYKFLGVEFGLVALSAAATVYSAIKQDKVETQLFELDNDLSKRVYIDWNDIFEL